ncbi:hypothetical protein BJY16_004315 [Actinoplanes octamycinicus]|uniref:DnaJ homologue subfamily C member 28 conserved domain-containing protein n=1 Tax=Actinoplanes octamycinicus TaxID=135948 RepID=A0A7W7GYW8_9ACTN|nr:DUF1992 domain-containing protein [Actinoplanes octamycinicus]MBB4740856.1 hypothetical protein [Actinoplanes octamycinicus]GIE55762.1 hypothetical protein Aoc01nite_11640 [Actinoplanes octamycinicus]
MDAYWYESSIDRQLRDATERGEFENLPGAGKPLSGYGEEYDEDWWVKDWLRREGATAGVIPPTLAVRQAVEDLETAVDRLHTERAVREHVAALNARIDKARWGHLDGPPVIVRRLAADAVVAAWAARAAAVRDAEVVVQVEAPATPRSRLARLLGRTA